MCRRRYFSPRRSSVLWDAVVELHGMVERALLAGPIECKGRELIWPCEVPRPGSWHFVAEVRNTDTTLESVKPHAKFRRGAEQAYGAGWAATRARRRPPRTRDGPATRSTS